MLLLANVGEELAVADQSAGQGNDLAIPSFEHRRSLVAARQFLGALRVTRHFHEMCRAALAESARMSRTTYSTPAGTTFGLRGPVQARYESHGPSERRGWRRPKHRRPPARKTRPIGGSGRCAPLAVGVAQATQITQVGNGRSESLAWLECGGRHRLGPLKSGTGSVGCSGSRCGWSRCPPLVVIGRRVGTAGSTRGRTGGTRP